MCKRFLAAFLVVVLIVAVVGCSPLDSENPSVSPTGFMPSPTGYHTTRTFESEEEFYVAVREARMQKKAGEQMDDYAALAEITAYYRPGKLPEGLSLCGIGVTKNGVVFSYCDDNNIENARFFWCRTADLSTWMDPESSAVAVHELNHNGIDYILMETASFGEGDTDRYLLKWVRDGRAFSTEIRPGYYSLEKMWDFSDYETVLVDAELDHK